MSLLCPALLEGRSATFTKNFLPARCLFNDDDRSKLLAVCLKTHKPVSVSVEPMLPGHDFDDLLSEFEHPNMNNLIGVVADPELSLYYTYRDHPTNCHSIKSFVKNFCKDSMDIRRHLHHVMQILVPLFQKLYVKGYGIHPMNEEALLFRKSRKGIKVILQREILYKQEKSFVNDFVAQDFKDNLVKVAQLFSEEMYGDVTDGNNLLPVEMEFFKACKDTLWTLMEFDYFTCDPKKWNEIDVGHNWDVLESSMAEESFVDAGEDSYDTNSASDDAIEDTDNVEKDSDDANEKPGDDISDSDNKAVNSDAGSDADSNSDDASERSGYGLCDSEAHSCSDGESPNNTLASYEEDVGECCADDSGDDDSFEFIEEQDLKDVEAEEAQEVYKATPPTHPPVPTETNYEEMVTDAAAYITNTISGLSRWWSS
uniref:Protein SHQ1 homolog n=2 Tax=Panagrellus redivivus TaxID=6233 RepID=A0A7E4UNF2_PANRE